MRKLYSIVNILSFLLVLFYTTSISPSSQLQHGVIVLGTISLLSSGYMTFMEYTDDTEEKNIEEFNKIKNTYKSKVEEISGKEQYFNTIQDENKQLVNDLTNTKKIVNKLASIIQDKDKPQEHPGMAAPINTMPPQENMSIDYHTEVNNRPPISNVDHNSGPPMPTNSMNDGPINIERSLQEYDSLIPKPSKPQEPDWLQAVETNPGKQNKSNMFNY